MPMMDGGLDLLDRQVLDNEGQPVGKVDDLELTAVGTGGGPVIEALLLGPTAYGRRLGGRVGRWIEHAAARIAGTPEPIRIPMSMVTEIATSVHLNVGIASLQRPQRLERWLRDHLIGRIPGARRAAE